MSGAANYPTDDVDLPPQSRDRLTDSGRQGASNAEYRKEALCARTDFRAITLADQASPEWNGWTRVSEPEGDGEPMTLPTAGTRD